MTVALIKPDAVEAGKVDQILEDVSYYNKRTFTLKEDKCIYSNRGSFFFLYFIVIKE